MSIVVTLVWSVAVALGFGSPSARLRATLLADGYTAVPITPIAGGTMYMVTCRYGDHVLKLGLDTGATSFAVIEVAAAKRIGLRVVSSGKQLDLGGERTVDMSYLPELTVGGFPAGGGSVTLSTLHQLRGPAAAARLGVELDGVLGHPCLDNNDAVIDYPTSTLFLRKPSQNGLARLAGDWACTRFEREGAVAPSEEAARNPLRVEGDTVRIGPPPNPLRMHLILNDRRSPKKMTLWGPFDNGSRVYTPGIYRLDGDELTICLLIDPNKATVAREFKTAPGSNTQLLVYRRSAK